MDTPVDFDKMTGTFSQDPSMEGRDYKFVTPKTRLPVSEAVRRMSLSIAKSGVRGSIQSAGQMWQYCANTLARIAPVSAEFLNPIQSATTAAEQKFHGQPPSDIDRLTAVLTEQQINRQLGSMGYGQR